MKKKNNIIFTGGSGKFGSVFRRIHQNKEILYPASNQLDIKNYKSIKIYLSKFKPKYFVHTAALSRPMDIHNKNLVSSIETNIIGTCNVVRACSERNIKLIYFSSNYVYPAKKGYYDEKSAVLGRMGVHAQAAVFEIGYSDSDGAPCRGGYKKLQK